MILSSGERAVWAAAFKSGMGKCPPDMDTDGGACGGRAGR